MSDSQIFNLIEARSLMDNTSTGVAYEWEDDGWLHVHGTQDNPYARSITSLETPIHIGTGRYTISVEVEAGGLGKYNYASFWTVDDSRLGMVTPSTVSIVSLTLSQLTAPSDIQISLNAGAKGATVDYRVRFMLVEGTEPAAWAPAEGESLAGGGAQMSANLWSDSTASMQIRADGTYLAGKAGTAELNSKVTGLDSLTENQTVHMGASLRGADSGSCQPYVEYADTAGNKNWVGFPMWTPTADWQRFDGSCVVPSGMTITALGFNNSRTTGAIEIANPTFSYGTSGPILASDSHTPYATQDHVRSEYAAKATTLGGYGITDAYTQAQTDAAIASAIDSKLAALDATASAY